MTNARPNPPPTSRSQKRERLAADAEITAYIHAISERHRSSHGEEDEASERPGNE